MEDPLIQRLLVHTGKSEKHENHNRVEVSRGVLWKRKKILFGEVFFTE